MKLNELLRNSRVSYQVVVSFDLRGAETKVYTELRDEFAKVLDLDVVLYQKYGRWWRGYGASI